MCRCKEEGNSLIEILVAAIILSVAALGAAGMQITSKKSAHESKQRFIATYLANDMIEKIRNNPTAQDIYIDSNFTGTALTAAPLTNCSDGNICDPEELANYDRWLWEQSLVSHLIQPTGCITFRGSNLIRVEISWWGAESLESTGNEATCGSVTSGHSRIVSNVTYIDI